MKERLKVERGTRGFLLKLSFYSRHTHFTWIVCYLWKGADEIYEAFPCRAIYVNNLLQHLA